MLGSGVTDADIKKGGGDGYASCSKRPDNLPQPISIFVGDLPQTIHAVLFQMFLDDFQAPVWKSRFQVTLNGTRLPNFGDTINQMNQTGPIGKLVTLRLLPEYWPILKSGTVSLLIDDPTTHKLDGYAVDFVRILVNPGPFRYVVTIHCMVSDADTGKPIARASLAAAQVNASTNSDGKATLRGIPAGLVSVNADAVGYDSAVQLVDLKAGSVGTAEFALHRHRENVGAAQQALDLSGTVAIYGIRFDTASARLRPESTSALETILQLIKSHPNAHWIISGHTDNQGGADYNLNLSDERARSVVAWLVRHGVANDVLVAKGYGLTRPVADNSTESGRALFRRVEVTIIK
jgi:OOP family OmpA-OmpF porin